MYALIRSADGYLKNIDRLDLPERASSSLLWRLFEPYKPWLEARNIVADTKARPRPDWRAILAACTQDAPPALVQSIIDLGHVASPDGIRELIAIMGAPHLALPLSPSDFALSTALDRPEAFHAAILRLQATKPRRFIEFDAADQPNGPGADLAQRIERLEHKLCKDLSASASGPCDVCAVETPSQLALLIARGRSMPPAKGCGACVMSSPATLAIYDKALRTLSVHARFPLSADACRVAIGQSLFSGSDCFSSRPVYSAMPISMLGSEALGTAGIAELCGVSLQGIKVRQVGRLGESRSLVGSDLRAWLASSMQRQQLTHGQVGYFQLGLRMAGSGVPHSIGVWPPNGIFIERGLDEQLVRELLQFHGFRVRSQPISNPVSTETNHA